LSHTYSSSLFHRSAPSVTTADCFAQRLNAQLFACSSAASRIASSYIFFTDFDFLAFDTHLYAMQLKSNCLITLLSFCTSTTATATTTTSSHKHYYYHR